MDLQAQRAQAHVALHLPFLPCAFSSNAPWVLTAKEPVPFGQWAPHVGILLPNLQGPKGPKREIDHDACMCSRFAYTRRCLHVRQVCMCEAQACEHALAQALAVPAVLAPHATPSAAPTCSQSSSE